MTRRRVDTGMAVVWFVVGMFALALAFAATHPSTLPDDGVRCSPYYCEASK